MGTTKKLASAPKSATVTKKTSPAKTKPEKVAKTPQAKPAKLKRVAARSSANKVTLSSLAAQIDVLSAQLKALEAFLRTGEPAERAERTEPDHTAKPAAPISTRDFDSQLLSAIADLDRRGRHGGMVPIPDVRVVFVEAGWTRASFDKFLLKAEADFLVDLKVANDPSRLPRPDLAIEEVGRGHLQYVVIR